MKYCSNCGKDLTEDMRFCPSCGAAVSSADGNAAPLRTEGRRRKKAKKMHWFLKLLLFLVIILAIGFAAVIFYAYQHFKLGVDPYDGMTAEEFKASCKIVSYEELARYPETYSGAHVKLKGQVVQVVTDGSLCEYRIATGSLGSNVVYCIFSRAEDGARLLEGDTVIIYGLAQGLFSYKSISGQQITIPEILITVIEF